MTLIRSDSSWVESRNKGDDAHNWEDSNEHERRQRSDDHNQRGKGDANIAESWRSIGSDQTDFYSLIQV